MTGCRRRTDERGGATLLVLTVAGVLLVATCGAAVVGGGLVAERRAQAAADLAALAGAVAVSRAGEPCREAAGVAGRNGARLVECATVGREVTVEVSVTGPRLAGHRLDASARARAGPVQEALVDPSDSSVLSP